MVCNTNYRKLSKDTFLLNHLLQRFCHLCCQLFTVIFTICQEKDLKFTNNLSRICENVLKWLKRNSKICPSISNTIFAHKILEVTKGIWVKYIIGIVKQHGCNVNISTVDSFKVFLAKLYCWFFDCLNGPACHWTTSVNYDWK